jgi:DNA-binding IclR family transcriptional regulator
MSIGCSYDRRVTIDVGSRPVVEKVAALLRALGMVGPLGGATSALARDANLSRPTAHRLLTLLAHEGLADRSTAGRWFLGPELYLLGGVAAARFDITEQAKEIVVELADRTGESAFLSAARGQETVCLLAEEGSFPLRSHVLHEGIRFPLGVASAGLAILAHLPVADADAYINASDLMAAWGRTHSRRALRTRVIATRDTGYAINPGLVVEGSWGLGAAVFDSAGRPAWALSLTGVESRFRPQRRHSLGRLLLRTAHQLTKAVTVSSGSDHGHGAQR